jgi:hypothetical protein
MTEGDNASSEDVAVAPPSGSGAGTRTARLPAREPMAVETVHPTPPRVLDASAVEPSTRAESIAFGIFERLLFGAFLLGLPLLMLGGGVLAVLVLVAALGGDTGGPAVWRVLAGCACLVLVAGLLLIRSSRSRREPGGGWSQPWPRRMRVGRGEEQIRRMELAVGLGFTTVATVALVLALGHWG